MLLHFHLDFKTTLGESIGIDYELNGNNESLHLLFQTYDGENWIGSLEIEKSSEVSYKYLLMKPNLEKVYEWGKHRITKPKQATEIFIQDQWRPRENEKNIFLSTAFVNSIFKRNIVQTKDSKVLKIKKNQIEFKLQCAQIPSHLKFGVVGSIKELGNWIDPIILNDQMFPTWVASIGSLDAKIDLEYKYIIYDPETKKIVDWEKGENRRLSFVFLNDQNNLLILSDDQYRHSSSLWKGSGVAIPVFSLRSKEGLGIGEFNDLIAMIDWTKRLGMEVIQVLPINDTIANKTWLDSYPYAAISVFALNPLYINVDSIAKFKNKSDHKILEQGKIKLNVLEQVDFEAVLKTKFEFFKILFDQEYEAFKKDKNVEQFIKTNASWLKPYAVFCHLRDKYNTCDFSQWEEYSIFSNETLTHLCNPKYEDIKEIEFYYFIQFHADKQLLAVKEYARENSVVLKGDLPIGIYRYSCDAWVKPELYNISEQAGAPPDDYAVLGQNWGFPTYNWEVMAQNGFVWWKNRML
jgi:4-alpha-glucanotransferase